MADDVPKRLSLAQKRALAQPLFLSNAVRVADDGPDIAPANWAEAVPEPLQAKKLISLRVDPDVLEFFKSQGPGYQTRMHAVLQAYMQVKKELSQP